MKFLRKIPFILTFAIIFFLIPNNTYANTTVTVNVETLNVRQDAGITFPIITQIHKGNTYEVLDENGTWIKIKLPDNKAGWVASWLVERNDLITERKVYSNVKQLNVRTGPNTSYKSIAKIDPHQSFTFLGEEGQWTKINFNGTEAWVASWLISSTTGEASVEVLKTATIDVELLNVRSEPSINTAIIGRLAKNTTVSIIDIKDGWYKISFNDGFGWIAGDYVKSASNSLEATVTVDILNLRSEPSTTSTILGKLTKDSIVTIIDQQDKWKKIADENGREGWVAGWYLSTSSHDIKNIPNIIVNYDGTNIRSGPSTRNQVVLRANKGDQFAIVSKEGDWYEISISDTETAFIAGWIVSTTNLLPTVENQRAQTVLNGKTIVIDPGHGGRDSGAIGVSGVLEKNLTLSTSKYLEESLKQIGAKVVLTHQGERYISLQSRVNISHTNKADAFISIHFNSSFDARAGGISTYYFHQTKDKALAEDIHKQLISYTDLRDRYAQYGNYYVLRRNEQPAVLLELGFLSKLQEETYVKTEQYHKLAADAIVQGLIHYFE